MTRRKKAKKPSNGADDEDSSKGKKKDKVEIEDYISGLMVAGKPEEVEAVQVFSKKLVKDFGYPKPHIRTHPQFMVPKTPSAKPSFPLDIAIFESDKHTLDTLSLIVECKRKNRKDGRRQLETYLGLTRANIGVWFNGNEHVYLRKIIGPRGRLNYQEIPTIPRYGQRIEDIGMFRRQDLVPPSNLKVIFHDIRNHLAGMTVGITRDEALAQEIINLLFCKILDEQETDPEDMVRFRVGLSESKRDMRTRINALFNDVKRKTFSDVFDKQDRLQLDVDSLFYVVGELQNYEISRAERDAIGEAFEVFIGPALRGAEGQFFTPRNVVRLAVDMLQITDEDSIIDPACGSGGFLTVALEYMWNNIDAKAKRRKWTEEQRITQRKETASSRIRGIDKDTFLSKVTKAYMAILGDGRGGIFCENALRLPEEWKSKCIDAVELASFNVVLTNPPFGAKIKVKGDDLLKQYDLARKWKLDDDKELSPTSTYVESSPPQILFIERCLQLLKPNGRMAIVLPDGILGNETSEYIRTFILQKAKLLAVVDLPKETFMPSTPTKTSLLLLQKWDNREQRKKYHIFMAQPKNVGHDQRGKPTGDDDLPKVGEEYKKFRDRYNVDF